MPRLSDRAPLTTMPTRLDRKKALNTQPYSRRSPRCRLTTGRMVATDRLSKATTVTVMARPAVSRRTARRPDPLSSRLEIRAASPHAQESGGRRWLPRRLGVRLRAFRQPLVPVAPEEAL